MRFLYSGLLDAFNVKRRYPHHKLPPSHNCSFSHVGWPGSGPCAWLWRGPCRDSSSGCTYDHNVNRLRIVFTWWRNNLKLNLPVPRADVLLTSAGVWESFDGNATTVQDKVERNLLLITSSVHARRVILYSNMPCLGAQREFFSSFRFPHSDFERRVLYGNEAIFRFARRKGYDYFDRRFSMITGNDTLSPCVEHHPYGKASDLHALIALHCINWRNLSHHIHYCYVLETLSHFPPPFHNTWDRLTQYNVHTAPPKAYFPPTPTLSWCILAIMQYEHVAFSGYLGARPERSTVPFAQIQRALWDCSRFQKETCRQKFRHEP